MQRNATKKMMSALFSRERGDVQGEGAEDASNIGAPLILVAQIGSR